MTMQAGCSVTILVALSVCLAKPSALEAAQECTKGQTSAPGIGCVQNSVVKQAKHNCRYGAAKTKDWTQCICNDGGKLAACGD
jgi:hypothetical protein